MRQHHLATLFACLLLAACGADTTAPTQAQPGEAGLPQPDAASGSITGMPNPGTPSARPQPLPEVAGDAQGMDADDVDGAPFDPNPPVTPAPTGRNGDIAIPAPETMPTMPAPIPDPVESRVIPSTES